MIPRRIEIRTEMEIKYRLNESDRYIGLTDEKKFIVCDVLNEYSPANYAFGRVGQKKHKNDEERLQAQRIANVMSKALRREHYRAVNKAYIRKHRKELKKLNNQTSEICAR